eukprot:gene5280-7340_t
MVGVNYIATDIGIRGGFAAQFQLAASELMFTLQASNFSIPITIVGKLTGYSDGHECDHVQQQYICYFKPVHKCHNELLKYGNRINAPRSNPNIPLIPPPFQSHGLAFWWGVIQYKMFQFQPIVEDYIMNEAKMKDNGNGFPFGLSIAGMHVRHGDKFVDGFRVHSLSEELNAIKKSPDCYIQNDYGDCFAKVGTYSNHSNTILFKLLKRHGVILDPKNVNYYNSSQAHANSSILVDSRKIITRMHSMGVKHSTPNHNHNNYIYNSSHHHILKEYMNENVSYVTPLKVFVASDDINVINGAKSLGFLADSSGVSQQTASTGMLATLLIHPEMGFNATLEIVSDIYFLSQCSSLLGIAASQVYRMAVAISNVTGVLNHAVAMDTDQIGRVRAMSQKYHIPFPEEFAKP